MITSYILWLYFKLKTFLIFEIYNIEKQHYSKAMFNSLQLMGTIYNLFDRLTCM